MSDQHNSFDAYAEALATQNNGGVSLTMTLEQAQSASHQGACDADVKALSEVPAIAAQLATFDPAEVAQDLREYGAWSTDELADHDQNLQRLLWLAAGDIREEDATAQR